MFVVNRLLRRIVYRYVSNRTGTTFYQSNAIERFANVLISAASPASFPLCRFSLVGNSPGTAEKQEKRGKGCTFVNRYVAIRTDVSRYSHLPIGKRARELEPSSGLRHWLQWMAHVIDEWLEICQHNLLLSSCSVFMLVNRHQRFSLSLCQTCARQISSSIRRKSEFFLPRSGNISGNPDIVATDKKK